MKLRCELHTHSRISDGVDDVREIVIHAIRKNIQVISITDHDTLEGSLRALEFVEKEQLPITVLPGYELSAQEGHLLIFGEPEMEIFEKGIQIREVSEEAEKKGYFTVLAHPYQFYRSGVRKPELVVKFVDGVEVFNSRTIFPYFTSKAERLAFSSNKIRIAGSDAHSKDGVGYGVTVLSIEENTNLNIKSILEALKSGKTDIEAKKFPFSGVIKESTLKVWRRLR